MGEMGRVRSSKKSNQIPKYGENGSLAYGGNGSGEKFKKIESNTEIWGEWESGIWGKWVG